MVRFRAVSICGVGRALDDVRRLGTSNAFLKIFTAGQRDLPAIGRYDDELRLGKARGSVSLLHRSSALGIRRSTSATEGMPAISHLLICDKSGTDKHLVVKEWLAECPRFHVHVTPTSSSWLKLVERGSG